MTKDIAHTHYFKFIAISYMQSFLNSNTTMSAFTVARTITFFAPECIITK